MGKPVVYRSGFVHLIYYGDSYDSSAKATI